MNNAVENNKAALDYLGMFKRRKLSMGVSAVTLLIITIIIAFGLPAIYQSKATILIQGQRIPKGLLPNTLDVYAGEQIQTIKARVLTQQNITDIANKFELFQKPDSGDRPAGTELTELFEENVEVGLVSVDVVDARGKPSTVIIAFNLIFNDPSPAKAQKVVNELTTMFLQENLRLRKDRASSAEEFFLSESSQLNQELTDLEQKIAEFKMQNEGSLPTQYNFNLSTLERTQREMLDVKLRIQTSEQRKIDLASQLAQLNPSSPVVLSSGEVVLSNQDRLKALQSDYRRKAAIYSDNHPDVVRLSEEIEALQMELGVETDIEDLRQQLQNQKRHLASLENKYTNDHQDIQNSRQLIALLEERIREESSSESFTFEPEPDNPAYILLQTQLNMIETEISSQKEKLNELAAKYEHYELLMKHAPDVERDYLALERDYENANKKYQETKTKQRETSLAKNLEEDRKAQRFILIEPASLPTEPVSPNRPAIFFLGLIFAAGSGLGLAVIRETMDTSIHGIAELYAIMGVPPLVAIPYIENDEDLELRRKKLRNVIVSSVVVAFAFIIFVHFFFKPLDVLYFVILNKLGLS